jgi:hypothetical protein
MHGSLNPCNIGSALAWMWQLTLAAKWWMNLQAHGPHTRGIIGAAYVGESSKSGHSDSPSGVTCMDGD